VLLLAEAFPCASVVAGPDHVEMDPASELAVRHAIDARGHAVVGWYHSHPRFRPDPSLEDVRTQRAYQSLFRDDQDTRLEPFVGLIVGPSFGAPDTAGMRAG
jgi:proteasome lid subunit RPN8/RPN11